MQPAGPLMIEHRLIEKMVSLISKGINKIKLEKKIDILFIDKTVDFMRVYADRCHHGKEENILFRCLSKKDISEDHKRIMDELVQEHIVGRETVKILVQARNNYGNGKEGALNEIINCFEKLVNFYPWHIAKEDKHFFLEVMEYFSDKEKEAILNEYWEFDRKLIHEKYQGLIENIQKEYFSDLDSCQSTVTAEQDRIGNKDEPCDAGIK
ncbi:MAG: hemerythrin domain-containing protein [Candidatus Omnitrophica bacterium]|nr:hemerythrin domain-containing protein [Candidatus Omnitrophota bacterium]